jgi:hypothetical protein
VVRTLWFLFLVWLAACNFNAHQFDDRFCSSDSDCTRPDQACVENVCTQRSCTANADCGTGYVFSCTVDGCVAQSCTADAECGVGFACDDHFCAASFNVQAAASTGNQTLTVTFDGPPDPTTATTLANYAVSGLDLTGTPSLSGSTVTLSTSAQAPQSYTLTVTNVTRASDKAPLGTSTATFTGRASFNVASATSISSRAVTLTFDGMPDVGEATTLANYGIAGLSLTGTPVVLGNTITLATSPQSETSYTVVVTGVHRAGDGEALSDPDAMFDGRNDFNITAAAAQTSGEVVVTFDAPPDTATATNPANYSITDASNNHLDVLGAPTIDATDGTKVHVSTAAQSAVTYTVAVANVKRANDAEPLSITTANFMGRTPFNVASASSVNSGTMTVTFDATPTPAEATNVANYSVPGLTLADPVLSGNKVTLVTSAQSSTSYTISVTGVTRQSDAEPLTLADASFNGRAPFDVSGAVSTSTSTVVVTFDAPPNAAEAGNPASYTIPGVTVTGVTSVQNSIVTLKTTPQSATTFTLTVAGVTRASDMEPLTAGTATFQGRAPFNVIAAVATSSTTIKVMFDADPDAAEATKLQNYTANNGLTFSGVTLLGSTATLTTSTQDAIGYSVTVSNVTRASDAEALTVQSASFTGRKPFKVLGAASTSNIAVTVTFDAAPDPNAATTLAFYQITSGNLSLTGTPILSGNTVTLTTSPQTGGAPYTITVSDSDVTRASDGEPLSNGNADFTGRSGFNVAGASSVSATSISVTFDGTPNSTQATTLGNYAVKDANNNTLALSGTPVLNGNTVTITTAPQAAGTYTVKVSGVTRTDATPLSIDTATFTHTAFNVSSAAATNSREITVTFDAPPNAGQATSLANYTITCGVACGLPTSSVTLNGNTVTIKTAAQTAGRTYMVTVTGVTRASDGSPLTTSSATFTGIGTFNVASAASTNSGTITVTFDAAPNPTQATTLANYSIGNLTLSGTPVLSGTTVTLTTSVQQQTNYTISVANVARASDGEPLFVANATFQGKAQVAPTVTGVTVLSTSPNNGTRFYNTGTATVMITGTELTGVDCPSGVHLDDLNGAGMAVNTRPVSCTVDSATQITATFPMGIRTNGTLGWNVQVTNTVGTNTTSSVKLVVYAGLLVSEVLAAQSGAGNGTHEFVEIYNPTANAIDLSAVGLAVHIREGNTDVNVAWNLINNSRKTIASHGYWLLASTQSTATNAWYSHRDATYDAMAGEMGNDSGVYLSLSTTAQAKVLDKVGWHNQNAIGYEGTAVNSNLAADASIQRKPAGGNGASTDTDVNASDFNAPNTSTTPRGTSDPAEP